MNSRTAGGHSHFPAAAAAGRQGATGCQPIHQAPYANLPHMGVPTPFPPPPKGEGHFPKLLSYSAQFYPIQQLSEAVPKIGRDAEPAFTDSCGQLHFAELR